MVQLGGEAHPELSQAAQEPPGPAGHTRSGGVGEGVTGEISSPLLASQITVTGTRMWGHWDHCMQRLSRGTSGHAGI